MNRGERIADAVRRGSGRVAIVLGDWCEAFRASTLDDPLAPQNRFLRLQAEFAPPGNGLRPPGYGGAAWWGTFDSAYTRVGDYVRRPESTPGAGDGAVWFIASQEPLLPVLCVRTTGMVDVSRPAGPAGRGVNTYGGVVRNAAVPVARRWPASLLAAGGSGAVGAELPARLPSGSWQVLMPAMPGAVLGRGDIVTEASGWTGVISSAELTALGWRLVVREAAA
jgi:hypothetical protein